MENPFDILGITMNHAKIINKLPNAQKRKCLSQLQRFYSLFLHPDVSEVPHHSLAKINSSIDILKNDLEFQEALHEYTKFGPGKSTVSREYVDDLRKEVKYLKNKVRNSDKILENKLAEKDNEIKHLSLFPV